MADTHEPMLGSVNDEKSTPLSPSIHAAESNLTPAQIAEQKKNDRLVLALTYAVLFSRYAIATFLSAFFPTYAADAGISGTFSGIIFSAYPLGITITSAFGTGWMRRLGLRSCVLIGMINTAVFTFLFGATPSMCNYVKMDASDQKWFFLIFYFLGGLGGALAETSCIMMANYRFRDNIGTVSASIGTVCGLGCMAGPPLGGLLYDYGDGTGLGAFFFPFFVFSAVPFLITAALPCTIPEENAEEEQDTSAAPLSQVMNKSRIITLFAMGLNGAVVATLDPTLEYRLDGEPFNYNSSLVGLVFMASSLSYTITSIPTGYILDIYKGQSGVFKTVQGLGFVTLMACFALLGPVQIKGLSSAFNNVPSGWIAMVLKGVGSTGNNACYPDLVIGVADKDEKMHATISGLWNAVYAIGWAVGPLIGGAMYQNLGFSGYATACAAMSGAAAIILFVASVPSVSGYLNNKVQPRVGFQPVGNDDEDSGAPYAEAHSMLEAVDEGDETS
mmetsp:Transcript_37540/g.72275  ORF Transcript_37540/g.72275 Transcript_37540/m.72275 type:complete len:502 (-) Transcript_37540:100-1605(-)